MKTYTPYDLVLELVNEGRISLEEIFERQQTKWNTIKSLGKYLYIHVGIFEKRELLLQSATQYGITAYRWMVAERPNICGVYLRQDVAEERGGCHLIMSGYYLDMDHLVRQILGVPFFKMYSREDVIKLCDVVSKMKVGDKMDISYVPFGVFTQPTIQFVMNTSECDTPEMAACGILQKVRALNF